MSEASLISSATATEGTDAKATDDAVKTDAKSAEDTKTDAAKTDDTAKKEPEKVEAKTEAKPLDLSDVTVEMPEGMEINKDLLAELGTLAGEMGLSKDNAAKLLPIGVKMAENFALKQQEVYAQTRQSWKDQVAADKEIGGADDKVRAGNLALASKGLDVYGSKELRTLLDESGLGDHPEVIRHFHKLGKIASEDKVEGGGSGAKTDPLSAMYPTMAKQA